MDKPQVSSRIPGPHVPGLRLLARFSSKSPFALGLTRGHLVMTVAASVAFAWAIAASALLFPFYSNNHDEPIYVFQALTLLQGKISIPVDGLSDFFVTWFSVNDGDKLFLKYTPVHAGFLAVGHLVFGAMRATLGFVAAGNVILLYLLGRELSIERRAALLGAVLLLLSPVFLFPSATFLPYNTTLLLDLGFGFLLLRGSRTGSPLLLVLAGLFLGLSFFSRPWDALLFAAPFSLVFFRLMWRSHRQTIRHAAWLSIGLIPIIGLALAYNAALTGNPLTLPQRAYDPLDTFGFGLRSMLPAPLGDLVMYDGRAAVQALNSSFLQLNLSVFGGPLLLGLALLHVLTARLRWQDGLLLLIFFVFSLGYFFYWGIYNVSVLWGADRYLGPYYFLPVLVPTALLAGQGLSRIFRWRPGVAALIALVMVVVGGALILSKIDRNYEYTQESRAIYSPVLEQDLQDALIFVPPAYGRLLHPFAYLANPPTLDAPILYANSGDNANFTLLDLYSGRTPYRFVYQGIYTDAPDDPIDTHLVRIHRDVLPELVQDLRIVNTTGKPYVYAYIWNNGQSETYLLDDSSRRGKVYDVRWSIRPGGIRFQGPAQEHLSALGPLSEETHLSVAVSFSDTGKLAGMDIFDRRFWFRITDGDQLEIAFPPEQWRNPRWPESGWYEDDIGYVMADNAD